MDRLLIAIGVAAGGLLTGIIAWTQLKRLRRKAADNRWSWDDLAITLLRDLALPAPAAAGIWASVLILDPRPELRTMIGRILVAALILVVSLTAARFIAGVVGSIAQAREGVAQSATIFVNITRAAVFGIGIMILLQSLGVSITPLLGALGVGGLAVALALQDTLANLFAGVHILASRKVEPGDYVRMDGGEEGQIVDINWRNTTIQQIQGNLIIVPNSRFADTILTNFHRPAQDLSVIVRAGVSYDSDLEQVERVTVEVAQEVMKEVEGGVPDHEAVVRFNNFGESTLDFIVVLRSREFEDQFRVVHEFIKRLHRRYRDEGIKIPYPTRTVALDASANGDS